MHEEDSEDYDIVDHKISIESFTTKYSTLRKGLYTDINMIIHEINNTVQILSDKFLQGTTMPYLTLSERTERVEYRAGQTLDLRSIHLNLNKRVWNILVIDYDKLLREIEIHMKKRIQKIIKNKLILLHEVLFNHKADAPYDLSAGIQSLFVFSDVAKPTFVGDSYSNLLSC